MSAMPLCARCKDRPAQVVYRATSDAPIPRCFSCAPQVSEALALGWLDDKGDAA